MKVLIQFIQHCQNIDLKMKHKMKLKDCNYLILIGLKFLKNIKYSEHVQYQIYYNTCPQDYQHTE